MVNLGLQVHDLHSPRLEGLENLKAIRFSRTSEQVRGLAKKVLERERTPPCPNSPTWLAPWNHRPCLVAMVTIKIGKEASRTSGHSACELTCSQWKWQRWEAERLDISVIALGTDSVDTGHLWLCVQILDLRAAHHIQSCSEGLATRFYLDD